MLCNRADRTTATASGVAVLEIIASAVSSFKLLELGITINSATASVFAVGVPAAKGITPTSPGAVQNINTLDTATTNTTTALAWGTGPTSPTTFIKRVSLGAYAGAGRVWEWRSDGGLIVPKNTSIVVWAIGTVSVADIEICIDE
jgi:hypothetical protein